MEGYLGEIRAFAGNFIPQYWALCNGNQMQISTNNALYSIIGTFYGGDGRTYFNLPNLQGRVPIGIGNGPEFTGVALGSAYGAKQAVLTITNMPTHNHTAILTNTTITGTASGNITPKCCGDGGDKNTPTSNAIAAFNNGFVSPSDAGDSMAPIPASLTVNGTASGTVAIGNTGGGQAFNIIQPSLGIQWIICVQGIYPSRS